MADVDKDGHQDVIARQDDSGDLWMYPGRSRRALLTTRTRLGIGGWQHTTGFGVTDWDRDGHQDVVARDNRSGDLWLYRGLSRRGLLTVTQTRIGSGFLEYTPFGLADWDRDGHEDIVAREDSSQVMWLYPGSSARVPSGSARAQIGSGW